MSKKGWVMRMKKPDNLPCIAKFASDDIEAEISKSQKPLRMYLKDEEIKEEAKKAEEPKDTEFTRCLK
jgi:hypothetical protein